MEQNNIIPAQQRTIAEIIEAHRQRRGLTKKQLADQMGIMPNNINRMMEAPGYPTLLRFAQALCISVAELVTDPDIEQGAVAPAAPPAAAPAPTIVIQPHVCPYCGHELHVTLE